MTEDTEGSGMGIINSRSERNLQEKRRDKVLSLTEVIVILVILAVLLGIVVPVLLNCIEDAKEKKYMLQVRNFMIAAQSEITELYARDVSLEIDRKNGTVSGTINDLKSLSGKKTPSGYGCAVTTNTRAYNVFLQGSQLAADIWDAAGIETDEQPYVCILGLGKSTIYLDPDNKLYDPHKAYTVYWAMYWQDKDDPDSVLYWNGSEWTKSFDLETVSTNRNGDLIEVNGEEIYFQLYVLKFINGHDNVRKVTDDDWAELQELFSGE